MSAVQWVSLGLVLAAAAAELMWARRNTQRYLMAIPLLALYLHVLIYYGCISWGVKLPGSTPFSFWSSILRLHELITLLGYSVYRLTSKPDRGNY
jgi:hypothetical protein